MNFMSRLKSKIAKASQFYLFLIAAKLREEGYANTRLLMVGGHDPLCVENVEHLKELKDLAEDKNLSMDGNDTDIIFKVIYTKLCSGPEGATIISATKNDSFHNKCNLANVYFHLVDQCINRRKD